MKLNFNIDLSATYTGKAVLKVKQIEDAQVDPVPKDNPPVVDITPEPYIPDPRLVDAVNLAIALGRPLLLQGDPGCGKTRLAYAVAHELGLPLETCYIKSTSRAQDLLYKHDAVNRLYDAQLGADGPKDKDDRPSCQNVRNYINFGPLGRAIIRASYGRRSVILIDEIDKADLDFPNDLLYELDRLSFSVVEDPSLQYNAPVTRPDLRPIIFITNNEEKALPSPFLRRCIYHELEFPSDEQQILNILSSHGVANTLLTQKAIERLYTLRKLNLIKKPGLSELIDFAGYASAKEMSIADLEKLHPGLLLKHKNDQRRAATETIG